jgi:hypothetical protein
MKEDGMTATSDAAAAKTAEAGAVAPNLFTFTGRQDDTQVVFSTTGGTGKAQFTYHDESRDHSADGDDVTIERGPFGPLVTVTLETVPDLHSLTVTLVLPDLGGLSWPITHSGRSLC